MLAHWFSPHGRWRAAAASLDFVFGNPPGAIVPFPILRNAQHNADRNLNSHILDHCQAVFGDEGVLDNLLMTVRGRRMDDHYRLTVAGYSSTRYLDVSNLHTFRTISTISMRQQMRAE